LSLKFANESSDPTMTVNLTDCSYSWLLMYLRVIHWP
jgi:hypothetical protein